MEYLHFLGRITICFILGISIGLERQYRRKTAGIRTITLVTLGAFLFVSISNLTPATDISRIAAQVVSGIGFLGAGVILRDGTNVRGLNTAATLWCSAAIGTLVALNLTIEAVIGVTYILLSNLLLRVVSREMTNKLNTKMQYYLLTIKCNEDKEMVAKSLLIQKLKSQQNSIKNFTTNKEESQIKIEVQLKMQSRHDSIDLIVNRLCIEQGINSVEYKSIANYLDDDDDDYQEK